MRVLPPRVNRESWEHTTLHVVTWLGHLLAVTGAAPPPKFNTHPRVVQLSGLVLFEWCEGADCKKVEPVWASRLGQ